MYTLYTAKKVFVLSNGAVMSLKQYLDDKYKREFLRTSKSLLGYNLTRFPDFARNLDGIQPGLYILGAETSVGKTAFMTNILLDLLQTNINVKGIYFSFDDNKDVIINRFLSLLTAIEINRVQIPHALPEVMLNILTSNGYSCLKEWADTGRLDILDMSDVHNFDELNEVIYAKRNQQLVVCIDGIHNINISHNSITHREQNVLRANKLKWLRDTYRIPLICSGEIKRKDSKTSMDHPTCNDILESSKFAYNANVVLMLHPENFALFKESTESHLMLYFEKNKISAFKGKQRLYFMKNNGRLLEDAATIKPTIDIINKLTECSYQY